MNRKTKNQVAEQILPLIEEAAEKAAGIKGVNWGLVEGLETLADNVRAACGEVTHITPRQKSNSIN